jgi:hypothetical protein
MIGDSDWVSRLNESERREWNEFVTQCNDELQPKLERSGFVMSLVPDADKVDVKFAIETGMAILMDKPIVIIAMPGTHIPEKLRKVADEVLVADIRTKAGQRKAAELVAKMMKKLDEEGT